MWSITESLQPDRKKYLSSLQEAKSCLKTAFSCGTSDRGSEWCTRSPLSSNDIPPANRVTDFCQQKVTTEPGLFFEQVKGLL